MSESNPGSLSVLDIGFTSAGQHALFGCDGMLTTNDGQIDYEGLVEIAMRDAMRGVIKSLLTEISKTGLPGEHHFYISFNTNAPGVNLSKRIKEKYPDEMTIVLQHRFWNLLVHADHFEVSLTFNSIPERLVIPFAAIRVFVDPSVRFGHQFDNPDSDQDSSAGDSDEAATASARTAGRAGPRNLAAVPPSRPDKRRAPGPRKRLTDKAADNADTSDTADTAMRGAVTEPQPAEAGPIPTVVASDRKANLASTADAPRHEGAKVVSLDQFRKK
jgi:uncharacterized protein